MIQKAQPCQDINLTMINSISTRRACIKLTVNQYWDYKFDGELYTVRRDEDSDVTMIFAPEDFIAFFKIVEV